MAKCCDAIHFILPKKYPMSLLAPRCYGLIYEFSGAFVIS